MRLASIVVQCISYYQLQTYLLRDRVKLSLVAGANCSLLIEGMGGEGRGNICSTLILV